MSSEDVMTVHILGIGSVGSICAYLLSKSRHRVAVLTRRPLVPPVIHPLNVKPIQLSELLDDTLGATSIKALLVTPKAHQTRSALAGHVNRITKDTLAIFLQNGMGIVDSVRDILPTKRIVLGTTTMGAHRDANNIHWVAKGQTLFSPEPPTSLSTNEQEIISYLGDLVPFDTLQERMFLKLAVNACINPVTAIFNLPNACVADTQSLAHALAMRLAKEIQSVYAIALPEMEMSKLDDLVVQLASDTGGNVSSMLADVRARRETEIDFINGYIVEMGARVGVNVPKNKAIIERVKQVAK